jgi:DNA-binding NarL/FixJ family response regulator
MGAGKGNPSMNIVIISDVRLHREGLASLLERVPNLNVVGVVDPKGVLQHPLPRKADAALLDAPSTECLNIVQPLRRQRRRLRIVAVGIREVESEVLACAAAGVDGYVPLNATTDDLVDALGGVMRRELVCSPKVAAPLYNCVGLLRAVSAEPLTVREIEVIDLMNSGLSNKDIARRLEIEASTAKNHVQNILLKLNVHRRGQAAAKLRGLIKDGFELPQQIGENHGFLPAGAVLSGCLAQLLRWLLPPAKGLSPKGLSPKGLTQCLAQLRPAAQRIGRMALPVAASAAASRQSIG